MECIPLSGQKIKQWEHMEGFTPGSLSEACRPDMSIATMSIDRVKNPGTSLFCLIHEFSRPKIK